MYQVDASVVANSLLALTHALIDSYEHSSTIADRVWITSDILTIYTNAADLLRFVIDARLLPRRVDLVLLYYPSAVCIILYYPSAI